MLSKAELLGASDVRQIEVDLPSIKGRVTVRSLPAAYSNQALSEAQELIIGPRGEQSARLNVAKLEALQVLHGLVEPKLDVIEDAYVFAQNCGPAWRTVVEAIDSISGIDKKSIEDTNARFQSGGTSAGGPVEPDGARAGNGRPDLSVRAGA